MNGDKLKAMREKRKLTQEQLAAHLNISRNFISAIENGRRKPSLAMLERIANVLNCSLKDFF
ncbi:helix-turn-helix domain-containing protein [Ornithinibacillus scapharcae]|uniref:helix-turn-helix domain-containing protein n=1 Tax=Ornithinibacillus scapharcae TaxID=1147159 RepID=UPI000225B417|nr:helix-turn-helix transcriptional regulator [Ornithinibacillus scapharcae]